MAISKIKTGSITDSAVNTDKLAPGSVGSTDLSATVISGQTELSETAADTDFTIIYDTSSGTLKKILRSNLKQSGPTVSSVSPTNATDAEATVTFTITGTGFTAGSTARLIGNLGKIQEFDTVTRTSTTSITATVAFSSLEQSQEPYDVQVTNGEGIAAILTNQVNIDASPVFVTSAGSLGSSRTSMSGVSVNATDPDSAGNVTFELQSGSLPPGISLTNTAADGGTATFTGTITSQSSDTVFNFTLRAVDAASNTTSRLFSFTALGPASESFTSSGTFSVPSGTTVVDVLVVGGGGGGSRGGGGAGGLIFFPSYPVTPSGTITVTVGLGAGAQTNSAFQGGAGCNSSFGSPGDPGLGSGGVLTAIGGGGGGKHDTNGNPGGSGGGGGTDNNATGGNATQPTQPGNSGAYGFGSGGGNAGGPSNSAGAGGGAGGGGEQGSVADQPGGSRGGQGGIGKAYTIADGTTPVYYAGGGAGAANTGSPGPGSNATGGQGGGGHSYSNFSPPGGGDGGANKGGGGGGSPATPSTPTYDGGAGGKGIVIVRY